MENANNRIEISKINSDMISLEKQISDVAEGLKDVVTKSLRYGTAKYNSVIVKLLKNSSLVLPQ